MKKPYLFLLMFLIGIPSVLSYTGQTQTNISVWITNTSISIYNTKLGNQTISINYSNLTEMQRNYSWNVDYQYDFSGQNVTIITYNCSSSDYNCNYTTYFEEIKLRLKSSEFNCSGVYSDAQNYYLRYFDCFTNLSICSSYRITNENYQLQRDSCESIKNAYYIENIQAKSDYNSINQSYSSCIINRDNYSSQRVVWGIGGVVLGILAGLYFLKVIPNRKKTSGGFSYSKHAPTEVETFNPMDFKPKEKSLQEGVNPYSHPPTPHQPEPINPYQLTPKPNPPEEKRAI